MKPVFKKTIFNEFVAFSYLQNNYQIKRLYALTSKCDCNGNVHWLSERSEQIMVYALCGFSNFQCIGKRGYITYNSSIYVSIHVSIYVSIYFSI